MNKDSAADPNIGARSLKVARHPLALHSPFVNEERTGYGRHNDVSAAVLSSESNKGGSLQWIKGG